MGKGTHKGFEYLAKSVRAVSKNNTRPCFVLKCDVRKFFDSINHQVLYEILSRRVKDAETLHLLRAIIASYNTGFTERERERE